MAQGGEKIPVEAFEEVLKKVLEEEKDTNWSHAKKFEHTDVWRKSEDDTSIHVFKVVIVKIACVYVVSVGRWNV